MTTPSQRETLPTALVERYAAKMFRTAYPKTPWTKDRMTFKEKELREYYAMSARVLINNLIDDPEMGAFLRRVLA